MRELGVGVGWGGGTTGMDEKEGNEGWRHRRDSGGRRGERLKKRERSKMQ